MWWVRFTSPDHRRIRVSTGTADKKAAQEYADKLKADSWRVCKLGDRPRRSWQEAVIRFLKETTHKRTHAQDIAKLKWLDPYLGHLMLDEVRPDVLRSIRDRIEGGHGPKGGSTRANCNRYLALVRSILRKAAGEWDWLDRPPVIKLHSEGPGSRQEYRWLTRSQADRLLRRLKPHRHIADMMRFTLATGLRERNVTGLTWSRVDIPRKVAWVSPIESKSRRALSVPLNEDAIRVLGYWHLRHPDNVFVWRCRPVKRANTKAWRDALRAEGLKPHRGKHQENFRWHDLRHTWATWHVMAGTPLEVLQQLGGWSSFEMVLRYAHLAPSHVAAYASNVSGTNLARFENETQCAPLESGLKH
ncbi:MAG: site-specific integrase [Pseudomonadota bacterium]